MRNKRTQEVIVERMKFEITDKYPEAKFGSWTDYGAFGIEIRFLATPDDTHERSAIYRCGETIILGF